MSAEDERLDVILMQIRSQEDLHIIDVRQAADMRVRALEEHLQTVQELQGAAGPGSPPQPGRPSCDPWRIVSMVTAELAGERIKVRYGAETDLTAAAGHAAQLLSALGVQAVVPPDDVPENGGVVAP